MTDPELPFSEDVERIIKAGPLFLRRLLPFWLASLLERSFILLLPIVTIQIPALKGIPWMYDLRIRKKQFCPGTPNLNCCSKR